MQTCPRCGSKHFGSAKPCSACLDAELSQSREMAIRGGPTMRDAVADDRSDEPGHTVDVRDLGSGPQTSHKARAGTPVLRPRPTRGSETPPKEATRGGASVRGTRASDGGRDAWIGQTLLGRFRIVSKLGEGGFGATYLAEQTQLTGTSKAVVKIIREDLPPQHLEEVRKRFLREVATLGKLDSSHLPKLLGSDRLGDHLFMVMEHAGDTTLTGLLKREQRLLPRRALVIAIQVCEALREAHRWSVVHRDVKPDNILLSQQNGADWVKLIDVGIAKILEGSEIDDPHSRLSREQLIIGTPHYMSPEQASGAPVDGRSDLYSLACVLFQLLAGRLPIPGRTPQELLAGHIGRRPLTLQQAGANLPAFLQTFFDRALQKTPGARFQTADRMLEALEEARDRCGRSTPGARVRRVHLPIAKVSLGLAALAAVAGLAFAIQAWGSSASPKPASARTAVPAPDGFVAFAGGTFQLGRGASEGSDQPDVPAHPVTVAPFALARVPVTAGEYAPFAEATGVPDPTASQPGDRSLPAVALPRIDATHYCAWRYPGGGRLPTEEEWEWAARGGGERRFPWGSDPRPACLNPSRGDGGHLEPAGSHSCAASPEGLLGMVGNAWEWTSSNASAYPGSAYPLPLGTAVVRGGSFFQEKPEELTATRRWFVAPTASPYIGFRCAFGPLAER